MDETSAIRHICESDWFSKLANEATEATATNVAMLISAAHDQSPNRLQYDTWRIHFAGKEILNYVSSRICHRPELRNNLPNADLLEDIAKDLAVWQVKNKSIPPELVELSDALHKRIAPNSTKA